MAAEKYKLIVTNKRGNKVHGEVMRVGNEISANGAIDLIIYIVNWLDFGTYPAEFITPTEHLQGSYEVWSSTMQSNEAAIVSGSFQRTRKS